MHVQASGTATFRINSNNQTVMIPAEDLNWECEADGERNMGNEFVYSAEIDVAGHHVNWTLREYPIGVPNHAETDVPEGLTLVADITYTLVHEAD
jgi:hypothetical protein